MRGGAAVKHIIAAFGAAWMRDLSFGQKVVRKLHDINTNDSIELVDWSFGTITAFQKLSERRFERAVFVGAAMRELRPGELHIWQPGDELPPESEIHQRICDCVMGMVSLENLIIMAQYYGTLPSSVLVIETEAIDQTWGETLSPEVHALVEPAAQLAMQFVARGVVPESREYLRHT